MMPRAACPGSPGACILAPWRRLWQRTYIEEPMNAFSLCRQHYLLLLLTCLCLAGMASADQTMSIPPFETGYGISRAGIPVGEAVLQLEYQGDTRYRMRSSLSTNGLASLLDERRESEEVEGELVGGIPRPLRYRAEKTGSEKRTVSMDFDWELRKVTILVNGEEGCLRLGSRTVDPLSLHLLVMLDLRSGTLAEQYEVAGHNRLKTYRIRSLGETTTTTAMGEFTTLAVSRQRPESSKAATFWHALELDFLPVQVSRTKDGNEKSRLTLDHLKR